ncbi:MAG: 23S rRNA (uracil(1939)-C(5))-methyltransferase RlmD [bacterium]
MRKNQNREIEVRIDNMAFGGYGVGRIDGLVVFVHRAYPGELVRAWVYKKKRTILFAEPIEVVEKSEFRREAPCEVFGQCGGCSHQDLKYEKQFEYKTEILKDSLQRIGEVQLPKEIQLIPADEEFHYRNKMEFGFSTDDDGELFLGQHLRGRFDSFVHAEKCLLMPKIGTKILETIEMAARHLKLPVYDGRSDSGLLRYVPLRFSETNGDYICSITVREKKTAEVESLLRVVEAEVPGMSAGVMIHNERTGDTAFGEPYNLIGKGFIEEEIGGIVFRISPLSFFQTNTAMARKFYGKILEYADLTGAERVLDLFCGTGTITQLMAKKASEVLGVESSESAVLDARESSERNKISTAKYICERVEKVSDRIFADFAPDVVILDPPRGGVSKKSLLKLLEYAPEAVVYASCNPTTLARDLQILSPKYKLAKLAIVDMFPQTYHVECVTRLELKG